MNKEAAITWEWDITKLLTTNDVTIDDNHVVRLNEKGALRVTIRFLEIILSNCDKREMTQDEKQKVVKLMDDVKEAMLSSNEPPEESILQWSQTVENDVRGLIEALIEGQGMNCHFRENLSGKGDGKSKVYVRASKYSSIKKGSITIEMGNIEKVQEWSARQFVETLNSRFAEKVKAAEEKASANSSHVHEEY